MDQVGMVLIPMVLIVVMRVATEPAACGKS